MADRRPSTLVKNVHRFSRQQHHEVEIPRDHELVVCGMKREQAFVSVTMFFAPVFVFQCICFKSKETKQVSLSASENLEQSCGANLRLLAGAKVCGPLRFHSEIPQRVEI